MSEPAILAAAIVVAVLVLGTCGIVAVRRRIDEINADRATAMRRIAAVQRDIDRGGRPHAGRFTLDPAAPPHGKAPHVSTTTERSENHG